MMFNTFFNPSDNELFRFYNRQWEEGMQGALYSSCAGFEDRWQADHLYNLAQIILADFIYTLQLICLTNNNSCK